MCGGRFIWWEILAKIFRVMQLTKSAFWIIGVLTVSITLVLSKKSNLSSPSHKSSVDSRANYSNDYGKCTKKFICYFPSWAGDRGDRWAYTIDTLNTSLCSHYIYAFAVLDKNTFEAVPSHPEIDIEKDYLRKFCDKVKAAGKKPLLAVGGWGDGASGSYEELFKDTKKQNKFIDSIFSILWTYGFEGLELDYEYPGCPLGNCMEPEAKDRFTEFVKKIHLAFGSEPSWTLSMAIPAGWHLLTYGYDLPALEKYVDWFNVMCYDYFDETTNVTYLHAPKKPLPNAPKQFNIDYTLKFIQNSNVSPESIILGMPTYGRGYTLKDPSQHTINSPASGPLKPGGPGAFHEICRKQQEGWKMETKYRGEYYGRWLYHEDQWIGYDDIPELRQKTNMIANQNLGGGMIWSLDSDDFRGECGRGISPLTTFLSQQILGNCVS